MNKQDAVQDANWLYRALDRYMEALNNEGNREDFAEASGNWDSGKLTRASSFGSCTKYHAAERHGLVKKSFNAQEKLRFEYGRRTGDMVCEAIKYANDIDSKYIGIEREARVSSSRGYAGTIDLGAFLPLSSTWTPIEVKFTAANRYKGFAETQVWQLIVYMELCRTHTGFLYTVYGGDMTPTHAVWTVQKEDDRWQVYNLAGEQVDTELTYTQERFDARQAEHVEFYDLFKKDRELTMTLVPDSVSSPFESWQCGYTKKPEYYKGNYKGSKEGDKRPDTGYFAPKCPLFMKCWGGLIPDIEVVPDKLEIEMDDAGKIEFTQ